MMLHLVSAAGFLIIAGIGWLLQTDRQKVGLKADS
jgi:hypothetical protein